MEPLYDEAVAYHEAGHAVAALALGRPVHGVSARPDRDIDQTPAGNSRPYPGV